MYSQIQTVPTTSVQAVTRPLMRLIRVSILGQGHVSSSDSEDSDDSEDFPPLLFPLWSLPLGFPLLVIHWLARFCLVIRLRIPSGTLRLVISPRIARFLLSCVDCDWIRFWQNTSIGEGSGSSGLQTGSSLNPSQVGGIEQPITGSGLSGRSKSGGPVIIYVL